MAAKLKKHEPIANPALAAAMRELRRSNAAVSHDPRPKRERSRQASKSAAIKVGW